MTLMIDLETRRAELQSGQVELWNRIVGPERWLHKTFQLAVTDREPGVMAEFWPPSEDPNDVAALLDVLPQSELVETLLREQARRDHLHSKRELAEARQSISAHYARRIETMAGCALIALYLTAPSQVPLKSRDGKLGTSPEALLLELVDHWPLMVFNTEKPNLDPHLRQRVLDQSRQALTAAEPMRSWAQAFAEAARTELVLANQPKLPALLESIATVRDLVLAFSAP